MKRKTTITICIVSIFVILLMLVGLTYGYYLTNIRGNENTKSITVATGNSKVLFTDLSDNDIEEIIEPGYVTVKTFTVENIGNVKATYSIYLVDVINTFNRTEDITYSLYRKEGQVTETINKDTDFSKWTELKKDVEFPVTVSAIQIDETIENPRDIYTYALKITYYNHPTVNQNEDQGKTFGGTVNVRATGTEINPFSEGTLAYNILDNGALVEKVEMKNILDPGCVGPGTPEDIEFCEEVGAYQDYPFLSGDKQYKKEYLEKTDITKIADGTDIAESGIFTAPDDFGTSYYFRGVVENNYVKFAGFTWKIVRINGDGSVRLILEDTLHKVKREGSNEVAGSEREFNADWTYTSPDNAYIGYMYGFPGTNTSVCLKTSNEGIVSKGSETKSECATAGGVWTSAYDATHMNINDSTVKDEVDLFYETYIESNANNYHYGEYLSDSIFCNDKTVSDNLTYYDINGNYNTGFGYGNNMTIYKSTERLLYSSKRISLTTLKPSYECAKGATNTYSRFTVNEYKTVKNVSTNGNLTYPIGLLTADELIYAGGIYKDYEPNYYFYLSRYTDPKILYDYTGAIDELAQWWTLTSYSNRENIGINQMFPYNPDLTVVGFFDSDVPIGVRPVINLKKDLLVESGNGKQESPYIVKLR